MCIQKHGRHGQLGCKHYTESVLVGGACATGPQRACHRTGRVKCLRFCSWVPCRVCAGSGSSLWGWLRQATSLRPTGALRAVGKRAKWEVFSRLLLRCAPWVPRATNRLKGCDEVSRRGCPHPCHQPCSWVQPRSRHLTDSQSSLSPNFFWSIVPKEAHRVLDAPSLGAQFFIRYIH